MYAHITLKSNNVKTGPIPVTTTEAKSCPTSCPLKGSGCYAEAGPLGMHWRDVKRGGRGITWAKLVKAIDNLPEGRLWRHNQAGDLPGVGDAIDGEKLKALVEANRGKRGFTYTHKPMDKATSRRLVRWANTQGFTVNLSADNLHEADTLASLGIGPVATLLPRLQSGGRGVKLFTPAGRRVIVCPAQTHEHVTCESCKLCALADRPFIVGFLAHGSSVRKAEAVFNGDLFSA